MNLEKPKNQKIAVMGGGISGLSVAYALMKERAPFSLFEPNDQIGGMIRTERRQGYLLEHGPNSLLNLNARLDDFCLEIGLESERIFQASESKSRFILKKRKLVSLPRSPFQFLTTQILSPLGKLRVLREPFIPAFRNKRAESISQFVRRRFGNEFMNYIVDPMIEGIYAGDPENLSMEATFSRLTDLEARFGSLVKGFIRRKREEKRDRRIDLFSFTGGLGVLPGRLFTILRDRIELESAVESLSRDISGEFVLEVRKGDRREAIRAGKVVLASPAYASARVVRHLSSLLADTLESIEYAPVAILNLGFSKSALLRPFTGSGCLIPKMEEFQLLGFRVNSNLYPGRAPEGKMLMTCFIGGTRNRGVLDKTDRELLDTALTELDLLLGLKSDPEFVHILRHEKAIPQYDLNHPGKIETIEKELRIIPGLYLAGNFLKGVSVWDCLSQGLELGRTISKE